MIGTSPITLLGRLARLERLGRYSEALESVSENWRAPNYELEVEELPVEQAARLLLRVGALIGRAGHSELVPGAQDRSKDLVTRARDLFSECGTAAELAECENYLALAYGRMREFREAEVWLDEAERRSLPSVSEVRLSTHLVRGWVYMVSGRHEEQVDLARRVEADFRRNGDPLLNGSFCSNVGLSLKDLGRVREALKYLNLARSFHTGSRNRTYQATVENNLALIYMQQARFDLAHECAEQAIALYKKLGDRAREASSRETQAQIYITQGAYEDGLRSVERSIKLLRRKGNLLYLSEALMTKAKVLLKLDNFADAVLAMMEAVEITRTQTSEGDARALIREFELSLGTRASASSALNPPAAHLDLVIPPALGGYSDYRTARVDISLIPEFGISNGAIVVLIDENTPRGLPMAVRDHATGEVFCGLFDNDFGIICLEGGDHDPRLFNESDIRVLGRIVGVCRDNRNAEGKLVAEAIKFAR